jgi:hypothetical protein
MNQRQEIISSKRRFIMSQEEEVHEVNRQVVTTAPKGDSGPFADVLDDGVEVVDHVAHLFESKASFLEYPQSVVADAESPTYAFHQFSGRDYGNDRSC